MQKPTEKLAARIKQTEDGIIRYAISEFWGTSDWQLADLQGRVSEEVRDKDRCFIVDGKRLVTFKPPVFVSGKQGVKAQVSFQIHKCPEGQL